MSNTQKRITKIIETRQGKYKKTGKDPEQEKAIEAAFAVATELQNNRKDDEAQKIYDEILKLEPHHPAVWHHMAVMALDKGKIEEAEERSLKSLESVPQYYPAWITLASVQRKKKKYTDALTSLSRALEVNPQNSATIVNKGNIHWEISEFEEAEKHYRQALEIEKGKGTHNTSTLINLGHAMRDIEKYDEALALYLQALETEPENIELLLTISTLHRITGDFKQSEVYSRKALSLDPENAFAAFNLSGVKKFSEGDPDLAVLEHLDRVVAKETLHYRPWIGALNFSLAKAYGDLKDHKKSFEKYIYANKVIRDGFTFSIENAEKSFDTIIKYLNEDLVRRLKDKGNPSEKPIFIIGMPRSGTTLAEQILASHPDVFGAGEQKLMFRSIIKNTRIDPLFYAQEALTKDVIKALTPEKVHGIGDDYLAKIDALAPNKKHVTDKMPTNFVLAGIIALAFPNAKIIHTMRDPLDTCVSCFTKNFSELTVWKYDMTEMARFYKYYQKLMAHWHALFPGRILDVRYEEVIADPENQIRRIVDYCGLRWDDRCLNFHETERAVRTASESQVRQPIYKTSVKSWKKYQDQIKPLIDILGTGE